MAEWQPAGPWRAWRARADVPATCANLGSGFDCLALAVDLRNRFEAALLPPGAPSSVELAGDLAHAAHLDARAESLVIRAFAAACVRAGVPAPPLAIRAVVHVPPGRGLGSSATAVIGGALAANALLGGPLSTDDLLAVAVACEPGNHPDNVAAALLGGLVVTGARDASGRLVTLPIPAPRELRAVLFVPDQPMSTVAGRALLPDAYPRADVTHNLSRAALLVAALAAGRPELLAVAMEDRLHQPYRAALFPALDPLIRAALAAGAYGACLSGGGSSILALAGGRAEDVCAALQAAAYDLDVPGRGMVVDISPHGAAASTDEPSISCPEVTP
jgi:homoserine kinase